MIYGLNRFHLIVLVTWQFSILYASQLIFPIFSNYVPKWRCGNSPISTSCVEFKRCNGTVVFEGVEFGSAVMEFAWLCENSAAAMRCTQLQFVGVFFGTILFGIASDAFGRKPVSIFALSLGFLSTFATGFVPSEDALFVARFFVGLSLGGTMVAVFTFMMEMLLPQQRMVMRGVFNWGIARLGLALICLIGKEWRMSAILGSLPAIPALLLIIFVFPESPTWLHSKKRIHEMIEAEKTIARRANIQYWPTQHRKIVKGKTICQLMQNGEMVRRLSVLWMIWFTASVCGYTNDFTSNTIFGDLFVNQILFGVLIYISKIILLALDTRFSWFTRRLLHQGAQLGVVIVFICQGALVFNDWHNSVLYIGLSLLGTVLIEYTWDACYLCAVESMETSARASATGSCSLMARVGAIIAPVFAHMNSTWPGTIHMVIVGLGLLNLIISYLLLVETKGVVLDDVVLDTEEEEEIRPIGDRQILKTRPRDDSESDY